MAVADQDTFSNISWTSDPHGNDDSYRRMAHDRSGAEVHHGPAHGKQTQTAGGHSDDDDFPMAHDAGVLGPEVLQCRVLSPLTENEGGSNPFTSYLVKTHKPIVAVRRRFTDFLFLYNALSKDFPACAVPPIPDKQRMVRVTGDRFGPDFTSRRAYALQRFLTRCSLHPVLRRSPLLHSFLETGEWNATMRSHAARASWDGGVGGGGGTLAGDAGGIGGGSSSGDAGGGGVASHMFDAFADSFINVFTKLHRVDRRFVEVREKSDRLDEDLGHIEKVVARVVRREADIEADLADLAEQFQKLLALEPAVGPAVRAFAASIEDTAAGLRGLREVTDQDYLGSLRDMVAYSGSLKSLLKAREQKQLDFEQLTEYLHKSTIDRDHLAQTTGGYVYGSSQSGGGGGGASSGSASAGGPSSGDGGGGGAVDETAGNSGTGDHHATAATTSNYLGGAAALGGSVGGGALAGASGFLRSKLEDVRGVDHEQSRRERQRKLELRVDELTTEVERAKKTSELFDEEVIKEVADFERIKRVEFKRQLGGLADAHMAYYDAVAGVWEAYVREMEQDGVLAA